MIDGRKAVASGEGLGCVVARRPTSFDVTTRDVGGDATLLVEVIGMFYCFGSLLVDG